MNRVFRLFGLAVAAFVFAAAPYAHAIERGKPVRALALYGKPKYAENFTHFEYANPNAPKGGTFVKANEAFLTFDTFNPYTLKGAQAYGADILLHDPLMVTSQDEPASIYSGIAETVEVAPDGSWVQFVLSPEAHFSDNTPITASDVVFSFETLVAKGRPQYRFIYADVDKATEIDARTVKFALKSTQNAKLPLLLGALPVLSKTYWKDRDFTATTLDIPVGSGPYTIEGFEVGRHVTYKRLDNYWGNNAPALRGHYNFERVRYEYFRDEDVEFEAFKTNAYDFTREMVARRWATGYDFPAFTEGRVKKLEVPNIQPRDVTTLVMNLRRPLFQDRRVREAINYAFDFESLNKNIMYGLYERLRSYWQGSPLEAKGLPSPEEVALLEPFRSQLPPALFTEEFKQPTTAGTGDNRENLVKARALLQEAGWEIKDGSLVNKQTGQPFSFEITLVQPNLERALSPWLQDLKRLGIEAKLRIVDTSQYANRVNDYDYDAIYIGMYTSLTPGTEMLDDLGSESADRPGGGNYSGIKDPVVDALIKRIVTADTYENVTTATRALDRVLTFNHYRVLRYAMPADRFAYWSKLQMPAVHPALGLGRMGEMAIALWWMDPAAATNTANPPTPATTSAGAAKDAPASFPWGLIILVTAGVGVVLFILIRRRRTSP
jgi:microcin C transport system substrate-binding protein